MMIYFLKPIGLPGPIKIGCSNIPENRLIALATWSPFPLEMIVTAPGNLKLEANIHDCFADAHSHREWFHPVPRLVKAIEAIVRGVPVAEAIDLNARKGSLRKTARVYPAETSKRLSYRMRVNWAVRRCGTADVYAHAPRDIMEILDRWSGYGKRPSVTPSDVEMHRLDTFLAAPVAMERTGPISKYRTDHGLSLDAFGAHFGVDKSTVCRWQKKGVPPERVLDVEQITGISRHLLRPDIFGPAPEAAAE